MVPNLSQTKERILIVGEEGSGRKLLARAIHFRTKAEVGAFHTIKPNKLHNWGAVLKKLSSNEKATVNSNSSNDHLEKLNSDTLFLSDIDKIPTSSHSALFHLLQFSQNLDHKLVNNPTFPERIIASASTNLSNLVDAGIFRKDLYFRLNEIQISIPPLRERVDDIPLLADFFSDRFTIETNKSFYNLSEETKKILCNYTWPGNVKELSVLIKKIILHGNESKLLDNLKSLTKKRPYTLLNNTVGDIYSLAELSDIKNYMKDLNNLSLKSICHVYMGRTEKKLMKKALQRTNGNRKKAALMLDISYKSFLNKIKAYNLQNL
jgi:two-component system response regulator AtoC